MNIQAFLKKQASKIEKTLVSLLPKENETPRALSQAMRYAVLSGGKRIRPIFTLGACEIVGGKETDVLEAACAFELIHSYSLVHDDLPCMDNDAERRGQPSCHAKFGEVTALLAGDALLTLAFKILSHTHGTKSSLVNSLLKKPHMQGATERPRRRTGRYVAQGSEEATQQMRLFQQTVSPLPQ